MLRQSRLKSKAAWAAILALVAFVLNTYFHTEIPKADQLINLILVAATALGVFNDPTNPNGY